MSLIKQQNFFLLFLNFVFLVIGFNVPSHAKSSIDKFTEQKIINFLNRFHVDLGRKNPEAIRKYYAAKVNWFNKPNFPRLKIIREQRAINKKFFKKIYYINRRIEITPVSIFPSRYKVKFTSRYKTLGKKGKKCGHWRGEVIIEIKTLEIINLQPRQDMMIISQSGYDLNLSCEKDDEVERNIWKNMKQIPPDLACAILLKNFRNEGCDIHMDFGCEKTCKWITGNSSCARNSSIRQVCWPHRTRSFQENYGR